MDRLEALLAATTERALATDVRVSNLEDDPADHDGAPGTHLMASAHEGEGEVEGSDRRLDLPACVDLTPVAATSAQQGPNAVPRSPSPILLESAAGSAPRARVSALRRSTGSAPRAIPPSTSTLGCDPATVLPAEVFVYLLSFVGSAADNASLARARLVSSAWCEAASNEMLFRHVTVDITDWEYLFGAAGAVGMGLQALARAPYLVQSVQRLDIVGSGDPTTRRKGGFRGVQAFFRMATRLESFACEPSVDYPMRIYRLLPPGLTGLNLASTLDPTTSLDLPLLECMALDNAASHQRILAPSSLCRLALTGDCPVDLEAILCQLAGSPAGPRLEALKVQGDGTGVGKDDWWRWLPKFVSLRELDLNTCAEHMYLSRGNLPPAARLGDAIAGLARLQVLILPIFHGDTEWEREVLAAVAGSGVRVLANCGPHNVDLLPVSLTHIQIEGMHRDTLGLLLARCSKLTHIRVPPGLRFNEVAAYELQRCRRRRLWIGQGGGAHNNWIRAAGRAYRPPRGPPRRLPIQRQVGRRDLDGAGGRVAETRRRPLGDRKAAGQRRGRLGPGVAAFRA